MPTQEQINAAQMELDIANDNYARMADKYNRYQRIFQSYANATPEQQERAKTAMQAALNDYQQLRLDMYAAEDRIAQAQNAVNSINEQIASQPTVATTGGQRRRTIKENPLDGRRNEPETINDTINNGFVVREGWQPVYNNKGEIVGEQRINPEVIAQPTPIQITGPNTTIAPTSTYVPSQTMIDVNNGKPGTLTSGGSNNPTVGEYLGNARNGFTQTYMNPNEIVYQSNSRLPGYNLGANVGRAGTVGTILAGGRGSAAPTTTEGVTYTVANSGRGIYNTPNAYNLVNKAGSSYIPAYTTKVSNAVNNTMNAAQKFANGRTIPEAVNKDFWKYVNGIGGNVSIRDAISPFLK